MPRRAAASRDVTRCGNTCTTCSVGAQLAGGRGCKNLAQDNDREDGDHRREVNHSGARHDLPDRRDDRLGQLDQHLRDWILPGTIEPGKNSAPNDRKLHDQEERVDNLIDGQC